MSKFEPFFHGVVKRECIEERRKKADAQRPQYNGCSKKALPLDLQIKEKAQVNEENAQYDEGQDAVQITF
jgi:hypothetical protein